MEEDNNLNNIKNGATPFNIYYKKVNGAEVIIDFENRNLTILNSNKEVESMVYFSQKIIDEFTVNDLIRVEDLINFKAYFIYENGYNNRNWLFVSGRIDVETLFD